jgi:hypothetical protein
MRGDDGSEAPYFFVSPLRFGWAEPQAFQPPYRRHFQVYDQWSPLLFLRVAFGPGCIIYGRADAATVYGHADAETIYGQPSYAIVRGTVCAC